MTESERDAGMLQALVERFDKYRLPRLLELKAKVDGGDVLSDMELDYLERVLHEALQNKSLVDRHPEWQKASARVLNLYNEVTSKALENEKGV